jgi:very-short-patch-repair endonuclease
MINLKRIFIEKKAHELRNNPTESEIKFANILNQLNISYVFQYPIKSKIKNKFYIVDFMALFHKKKIVFEIDGEYHSRPEQVIKDRIRDYDLVRKKYDVYRFTNEEIENNKEDVLKNLQEIIMFQNRAFEKKKEITKENEKNRLKNIEIKKKLTKI